MSDHTQDEPALAQNATNDAERLAGLLDQVRADMRGQDAATVERDLRDRLRDSGIVVDEDLVQTLVDEITG